MGAAADLDAYNQSPLTMYDTILEGALEARWLGIWWTWDLDMRPFLQQRIAASWAVGHPVVSLCAAGRLHLSGAVRLIEAKMKPHESQHQSENASLLKNETCNMKQ